MRAFSNPFCYTDPLPPTSQLHVPDPSIPYIVDDLLSHRCCLIVGPPTSGTTSTLLAVQETYTKRLSEAIWWYIDLAQLPTSDPKSLFQAIARDGASRFPDQACWANVIDDLSFDRAIVRSVASARRPLVLAIDHLENIPVSVIQTIIRGVRKFYAGRGESGTFHKFISVVLAGSRQLYRQGEGRGSPLNFARIYYVQDLQPDVAEQMLLAAAEGQAWEFDISAAQYLANVTNGDKYLLQRLGYDCVARLAEQDEASITLDLAQQSVTDFVEAGFREDPQFGKLLPSLIRDGNAIDTVLNLLNHSIIEAPLARLLHSDIAPNVTGVFKEEGGSVVIRNEIYRRILLEHVPVLDAVRAVHRSAQQRVSRARRLKRLISRVELGWADEEALRTTLAEIRDFIEARDVSLFAYDERQHRLVVMGSTQESAESFATISPEGNVLIRMLQRANGRLPCPFGEPCPVGTSIGYASGNCSWIPLKEQRAGRLVGALALIDQPLVMPVQRERELMDLAGTLADALQRRRHLEGLRRLSRIRVDLPRAEVEHEICETASFLFNRPFALLWQGARGWPPVPLQTAVGVDQGHFAELGFMLDEALCRQLDSTYPKTLLVSAQQDGDSPMSPEVMSRIGLDRLLLICFPMQDKRVGVLGVGASEQWQPTDREMTFAQLVAKQASVILENLHVYHQIQRRLESSQLAVPLLSHELKRKPRAVAGELELLLCGNEGGLTAHQVKILNRIQMYLGEHERLIDTILDVTRLDAETYHATMTVQPILPVLRGVLAHVTAEVEKAGMRLETDLSPTLPSHRLDSTLVEHIITNLVQNAVQYARRGAVRVRAWGDDGRTLVGVEDEGPGVPPEFRDRIFEQWHRGPFSRGIAGRPGNLGLGLYFVRKVMELHGGLAEYDETYSDGARFLLVFPKLEGGYKDDASGGLDD